MTHHEAALRRELEKTMKQDEAKSFISGIKDHRNSSVLTDEDKAILNYAVKLTLTPAKVCKEDTDKLRTFGFDDRAIHDICAVTAYFNFVNRMADGLGVELEH